MALESSQPGAGRPAAWDGPSGQQSEAALPLKNIQLSFKTIRLPEDVLARSGLSFTSLTERLWLVIGRTVLGRTERAIDEHGAVLEALLQWHCDAAAATSFFDRLPNVYWVKTSAG